MPKLFIHHSSFNHAKGIGSAPYIACFAFYHTGIRKGEKVPAGTIYISDIQGRTASAGDRCNFRRYYYWACSSEI